MKPKAVKNIITLLCLLSIFSSSFSQDVPQNIRNYSINDGLSNNYSRLIKQDKLGYIWIGTKDGLNRFDGYKFKIFKHNYSDTSSLSNNSIKDLFVSEDSLLWVVNDAGLDVYNQKTNRFKNIILNRKKNASQEGFTIKSVLVEDKETIWLRTFKGIIEYNPIKKSFSEYSISSDKTYQNSIFYSYKIFDDGINLWTNSSKGLIKFNKKTKKIYCYKINEEGNESNEIHTVFSRNKDYVWLSSFDKLYVFNTKTETFNLVKENTAFEHIKTIYVDKDNTVKIGTSNGFFLKKTANDFKKIRLENYVYYNADLKKIFDIIEDKTGINWICSNRGIYKVDFKKKMFNVYQTTNEGSSIFSSSVYAIYHNPKSNVIWTGTRRNGINVLNRKTGSLKHITSKNSILKTNNIFCIREDSAKNLWIGTDKGFYIWSQKKKAFTSLFSDFIKKYYAYFENNRLNDILFDEDCIWFATFKGVYKYKNGTFTVYRKSEKQNSLISNQTFKIIKEKKGIYWIATLYGLSRFDAKTKTFTNYTKDNKNLSNEVVPTVFFSKDSTIWVGTGSGLNKYIPEKDSFVFYTTKNSGFNNDFVYTISEDLKNNIWISTNKGIIQFNPKTKDVINYTISDNLQSNEFNVNSLYKNKENEIFWGGIDGFCSLNFNELNKASYTPQVIITNIYTRTKKGIRELNIKNTDKIVLSYKENSFDIHFAIPEYTYPEKNTFKYRIKNMNTTWTHLGNTNYINFFRLNPGIYNIEIIGADSNNNWTKEPIKITIEIRSPWWKKTNAVILYIVFLILILILIFFVINKEIRKENKVLQEKQIIAQQIAKQKEQLAIKNNNITESMRYAFGIIRALLPTNEQFKKILPESFALFHSKEIVSGDFYWIEENEEKIFVAAVDCTGHGVPGAFMSIIGLNLLRNITKSGINTPSKILNHLSRNIYNMFQNEEQGHKLKDGMDLSIIAINKHNNTLEFAGAVNKLYLIRDGKITEIKGDSFSVSPINYLTYGSYTNHTIEFQENDMIYIFSDGYVDQFGGPDNKKFKYRRFRNMLLNNYEKPAHEQKEVLERVLKTWKGEQEQIDDILVIGIRLQRFF